MLDDQQKHRSCAAAPHERSDAGGCAAFGSPRSVTRGETHVADEFTSPYAAFVDWLAFTVKPPPGQDRRWLEHALQVAFDVPCQGWRDLGRGWFGYDRRMDLGEFGLLAYGGTVQKGTLHVELNAHACARIVDWNAVRLWGETYDAALTRVDVAHDDFAGEQVTVEQAVCWYRDGRFSVGGRPPAPDYRDDLGTGRGKTLYLGKREAGKLLRVYEKGKQLGDPSSSWVRVEVELRNKSRLVPWDAVVRPGCYLAGAYPALRFLSAQQVRIHTVQRAASISYESMVKTLRTQGGKALHVMCEVHQGDAGAVLAEVVREGVPKRLAGYPESVLRSVREAAG